MAAECVERRYDAPLVAWETDGTAANNCIDASATANWNVDSPNQSCNGVFLY